MIEMLSKYCKYMSRFYDYFAMYGLIFHNIINFLRDSVPFQTRAVMENETIGFTKTIPLILIIFISITQLVDYYANPAF